MLEHFRRLGERCLVVLRYSGGMWILFIETVLWVFLPPMRRKQVIAQMNEIGVNSLPIVLMTSFFTGMVLALQSAYQMQRVSAEMYIASLVAISMCRELGPVLTALVVAGRVGAAITAELGTMKVTEQVDALETLATNPVKYLVVPRFLALFFMLPLLTIYADAVGILGGYLIGVGKLGRLRIFYALQAYKAQAFGHAAPYLVPLPIRVFDQVKSHVLFHCKRIEKRRALEQHPEFHPEFIQFPFGQFCYIGAVYYDLA
ncbi:MAG: ABC transporter permease [Candidatus Omnitrophica bacterium]|nr:ABC transporter permease [Candidatus Omnitrophota bacterium]